MTAIQFTLDYDLNASVQIGDILYFTNTTANQGFNSQIIEIGPITNLTYPVSIMSSALNNGLGMANTNYPGGGIIHLDFFNANISNGMSITALDVEEPPGVVAGITYAWDVNTVLDPTQDTLVTGYNGSNVWGIAPGPITNLGNLSGKFLFQETFNVIIEADMPQPQHTLYSQDITPDSFLLFSKDNKANMSSMLGYYADIQFKNSSYQYAELFQIGAEVIESSK